MEREEYKKHYELEESHWWFGGRRRIIHRILRLLPSDSGRPTHLDVGCGTGFDLLLFGERFDSFGCDLAKDALFFCKKRNLKKIVQADAAGLPFKNETFDFISLLDVLYHKNIDSDGTVLREVRRILKPNGHILITDSAFNFLYSKHDIAFHARERYTKKTLGDRLKKNGFVVKKLSYYNFFLFGFVVLVRMWRKIHPIMSGVPKSDLEAMNKTFNRILFNTLKTEASLVRIINLPFGSSILCLAQKSQPAKILP